MTDRLAGLCIDRILAGARTMTGCFDTLDPGLERRLGELIDGFNRHGRRDREQTVAAEAQLRALVARRLRIAADRGRLAGIKEEAITRPVFVIGFSRTGTTLLHSLLSQDPIARAPRWWHTHSPSPAPGEMPVARARLADAAADLQRFLNRCPGLLTLHPYWDEAEETLIEDEQIATLDLQNAYPSLLFDICGQEVMGQSFEPRGAHAFQREFLQHLQWNTAPARWVCKGVYHQFSLGTLFEIFPDALCIWPHRDPVAVQASTLAIAAVVYGGINHWDLDRATMAAKMVQATSAALDHVVDDPLVDDPRIFHLRFDHLIHDPVGSVRAAYQRWQLPFTTAFEQAMRAWLASPGNRSDRYGRYQYSLEPFGLNVEQVREMFVRYSRRFELDASAG